MPHSNPPVSDGAPRSGRPIRRCNYLLQYLSHGSITDIRKGTQEFEDGYEYGKRWATAYKALEGYDFGKGYGCGSA